MIANMLDNKGFLSTSVARISWLTIVFAVCLAAQARTGRAAPDKQGAQAAAAKPCSGGKASSSSKSLEDVPLSIPPATSKDQTLVVRVVVEQPYIDNVATHVTYNGLDHVFGIVWQVGKTQGYLRVPEALVIEEPVAADILDCTDKGVSMPARYTPLTAPRLVPYLIEVREQWSREFDEMAAASTKMAAVALVISLRTTAAPATAATAAQKSLGTARTSTPKPPAAEPARTTSSAAATAKPTAAKPTQAKLTTAKSATATVDGASNATGSLSATEASVADKLNRYLLNPAHPVGGPKAKWFQEALGFTRANADDLAKQIVFDARKAVQTAVTKHGTKFNQVISITGANGRVIDVTFAWIRNNDGVVRLITGIPTKL